MQLSNTFNPRYVDAQNFSQNAASLLLTKGTVGLADFLKSLEFPTRPDNNGTGFYAVCPVCRSQTCYIGTNGKNHTVYWLCLDKTRTCESTLESFRTPRNLLSLVKFIVGTQGKAYKGCDRRMMSAEIQAAKRSCRKIPFPSPNPEDSP